MENRTHYIITSERAYRRNDEYRNDFYSPRTYAVGDTVILDGLVWIIDEVIGKEEVAR